MIPIKIAEVEKTFSQLICSFLTVFIATYINTGIKNRVKGNALELPFKKDVFDSVCAFEILEHVWGAKLLIEEANRVLKKGGKYLRSRMQFPPPRQAHYEIAMTRQ